MRVRWAILVCALGAATVAGCLSPADRPPTSVARLLNTAQPTNGIYLESIILERPVGDPFLDRDLWAAALPVGATDTRALLSENGLRAGILAGTLPPKFQTLLESETEAVNGRGLSFAMRREDVLPTSGPFDRITFKVLTDLASTRAKVTLEQAQGGIQVRPEALPDGRVRVRCEPQVQHGEKREWLRPSADDTGFVKHEEVPLLRYNTLAFDAVLNRDDYLVIGWQADQPSTLGSVLFATDAGGRPRQRVLVVRVRQMNPGRAPDLPALGPPSRRRSVAAEAGEPRR